MDELRTLVGSLRSQMQRSEELAPAQREKLGAVEQALSAYIREGGESGSATLAPAIVAATEELGSHHAEMSSILQQIQEKI